MPSRKLEKQSLSLSQIHQMIKHYNGGEINDLRSLIKIGYACYMCAGLIDGKYTMKKRMCKECKYDERDEDGIPT